MEQEEYFKIKMEMKLLDGGYYDIRIYKYINGEGHEQWEKDFHSIMWIRTSSYNKTATGKYPTLDVNRSWWFKTVLHPEFFNDDDIGEQNV